MEQRALLASTVVADYRPAAVLLLRTPALLAPESAATLAEAVPALNGSLELARAHQCKAALLGWSGVYVGTKANASLLAGSLCAAGLLATIVAHD
jgi:hypothetical protein